MAPVLYMTSLSPPSRAVLMVAEALKLDLELKNVDLSKGEHRKPEYLKLNPLHSVPTLVDDDVIITDSHAITAYLVQKYSNDDLYPKDPAKRALVDQRLHFDSSILFNLFRAAVAPIFYRKSKEVAEEEAKRVLEGYNFLESFLDGEEWMAGDRVTIADVSLMTTVTALDLLVPLGSGSFPRVISWVERVKELSWAKVNEEGFKILKEVIDKCRS